MNRDTDLDRSLDSWFAEGPTALPEHAIDAIVRRLDDTNQRRPVWLPGGQRMNRMTTWIGLAAAGLAAVAALLYLNPAGGLNIGGPAATPSPTTTPSPTAAPTKLPVGAGATVNPGMYFVEVERYRFTYTVSGTGWSVVAADAIGKGDEANDPPDFAALAFWGTPSHMWAEPCDWGGTEPLTPGPTVDDFVTALSAQSGWETSEPTDVTVDGYDGKRLQLQIPDDVNFAECGSREYRSYEGRYYQGPGQVDDLWILDLDGARHVLVKSYFPTTPTEWQSDIDQMVASIEIQPLTKP